VKAAATDAVAYYKQFGRQAREFHRNCAVIADGFVVDERCCFSCLVQGEPRALRPERALAIYADAALECADAGFCAWTVLDDELVYVQGEWTADERRDAFICDLELAASTFGLVALTPESGRSFVYSFTDNVNAKAAMRSATPKTELMQTLCRARVDWLIANRVAEAAERITSKANLWADLGSRGKLAEMLEQAKMLGLSTRRVQIPPGWRELLRPKEGGRDRGADEGSGVW
jgi:hypothetical protein